jgi:hypothetical protein
MHDHMRILRRHSRVSNNVADGDELAVMARHATVCREFAGPERCDEGSRTSDASIAISRIGSYEFIGVALPIQAIVSHKVEQCKLIVCNYSQQSQAAYDCRISYLLGRRTQTGHPIDEASGRGSRLS